jgi:hypothetical protein
MFHATGKASSDLLVRLDARRNPTAYALFAKTLGIQV